MSQIPARKAALLRWGEQAIPKLEKMGRQSDADRLAVLLDKVTVDERMLEWARELLRMFQSLHGLHPTGTWNSKTVKRLKPFMFKTKRRYRILTMFRAIHHSGRRPVSWIRRLCIHCTQYDDTGTPDSGAEALGRMTQSSGYRASPHAGVDDDSIQEYLPPSFQGWQVEGDNQHSFGLEFFGFAHWSYATWMKHERMLDMGAYYIARRCVQYGIPIRLLTAGDIRNDRKGIETHGAVTKALGIRGGHTDPGDGFPVDWVLKRARWYAQG